MTSHTSSWTLWSSSWGMATVWLSLSFSSPFHFFNIKAMAKTWHIRCILVKAWLKWSINGISYHSKLHTLLSPCWAIMKEISWSRLGVLLWSPFTFLSLCSLFYMKRFFVHESMKSFTQKSCNSWSSIKEPIMIGTTFLYLCLLRSLTGLKNRVHEKHLNNIIG